MGSLDFGRAPALGVGREPVCGVVLGARRATGGDLAPEVPVIGAVEDLACYGLRMLCRRHERHSSCYVLR